VRRIVLIYIAGIVVAGLWLFIEITGYRFILVGITILGITIISLLIFNVWRTSSTDPYQQYVRQHNEKAAQLREQERIETEQAQIDQSDD
jgi:ABC-type dipeptide/oligopeptide/nickel transport system permease component